MSRRDTFIQHAEGTPFDNTTQNGHTATNVQKALEDLVNFQILNPTSTTTTLNGTLTLTVASNSYQFLTGTQTGFSVVLPSANTLFKGHTYTVFNTTNQTVNIKDASNNTLLVLAQNSVSYIYLQDNSTAQGTWVFWQVLASSIATGIINYYVISSTAFNTNSATNVLVTGMSVTPQAGTYAVWLANQWQCSNSSALIQFSIFNNGVQIADSLRTVQNSGASRPTPFSTQTITQVNGSQAIDLRVNTSAGTLTVGARSLILIRLGT